MSTKTLGWLVGARDAKKLGSSCSAILKVNYQLIIQKTYYSSLALPTKACIALYTWQCWKIQPQRQGQYGESTLSVFSSWGSQY